MRAVTGMIIAGPEVAVGAIALGLAADDHRHLGVGLPVDETIDHLHSSTFERVGPEDVLLLVEACLQLDDGGDRLAGVRGVDQRLDDRRLLARAIERLLDRDDVRVGRRLPHELHDNLEALVGMVDEDVLLADRREAVAAMLADAFGEARIERPELQVRPVLIDDGRKVVQPEQREFVGDDRIACVEALLDAPNERSPAFPARSPDERPGHGGGV